MDTAEAASDGSATGPRRIVAAGSGWEGLAEPQVRDAIIRLSHKATPSVLYLGTATYDQPVPEQGQTSRFAELGCAVTALKMVSSTPTYEEMQAWMEGASSAATTVSLPHSPSSSSSAAAAAPASPGVLSTVHTCSAFDALFDKIYVDNTAPSMEWLGRNSHMIMTTPQCGVPMVQRTELLEQAYKIARQQQRKDWRLGDRPGHNQVFLALLLRRQHRRRV